MVQNLWTTGFFHASPLPYRLVKIFLLYSRWCFWPFPLSIQFHALLFVLIAVFHKNTPNTGCPVLGVHIKFKQSAKNGRSAKKFVLSVTVLTESFSLSRIEKRQRNCWFFIHRTNSRFRLDMNCSGETMEEKKLFLQCNTISTSISQQQLKRIRRFISMFLFRLPQRVIMSGITKLTDCSQNV